MRSPKGASLTVEDLLAQSRWAEALARRLTNSDPDAEDLLQDAWMATLRARPTKREGLRPWLTEVFRNAASNRRRTDRRRRSRDTEAGNRTAQITVPSPEELVGRVQVQRLLADHVLALPPPIREVILLRYYQGLSGVEIARALGAPEGTIRWRLKVGLDELRRALAEQHGGQDDWRRALAPLLVLGTNENSGAGSSAPSERPGRIRSPGRLVAVAVTTVLVGVGYSLLAPPAEKPGAGPQPPLLAEVAREGPPGSRAGLADLPAKDSLDACRNRVLSLRANAAHVEADYVSTVRSETLFREGHANPVAQAALSPVIARVMKDDGGPGPDHALDCHLWACRLEILEPEGAITTPWTKRLRDEPDVSERLRHSGLRSGLPVHDPVSRITFRRSILHFTLASPAGTRVPRGTGTPGARWRPTIAPAAKPPPSTLAACRAEVGTLTRKIALWRATTERETPLDERWVREAANPELTREIDATVRRNLRVSPNSPVVQVECAGQICRVKAAPHTFPDLNALYGEMRAGDLGRRLEMTMTKGLESWHLVRAADTADGTAWARRVYDRWLVSPDLEDCERRQMPIGQLHVQIIVPRSGDTDEEGQPMPVTSEVSGVLAGTEFGRCAETTLAQSLAAHPLPSKTTGARLVRSLEYPRQEHSTSGHQAAPGGRGALAP